MHVVVCKHGTQKELSAAGKIEKRKSKTYMCVFNSSPLCCSCVLVSGARTTVMVLAMSLSKLEDGLF